MKCDIKIMASPKRYAHVLNTCKILGLDIDKDVFFDDRPSGGDAAYTSEKTWSLPFESDEVTHRCVLQDDVLCCKNFESVLNTIVNQYPEDMFSLFCPSSKMIAIKQRSNKPQFVNIKKCGVYGPAIVVPRNIISRIYVWGRLVAGDSKIVHDDVLFGEYALEHRLRVLTTVPNLVQHLCPTQSLLGYGRESKVSKCFDMEAGNLDWSMANDDISITIPNSMKFYK